MAVDMVALADRYDTAILVSGDGDLAPAVDYLINRGVQVNIAGIKANTKDVLMKNVDCWIDLESIKHQICLYRDGSSVRKSNALLARQNNYNGWQPKKDGNQDSREDNQPQSSSAYDENILHELESRIQHTMTQFK